MPKPPCEFSVDHLGVARIRLNRPESHNALNPEILQMLGDILRRLDRNPDVRSVELSSAGKHFCSGLDLQWLKESCHCSNNTVNADFYRLGELMHTLYNLTKPTIAIVQGAAYGGGAGLVCCCDIAVAANSARFCFSEVRLGLIPSIISPYVIRSIGERMARRYFLTAEVIPATDAARMGLVHEIVNETKLPNTALKFHQALNQGAPKAISRVKSLLTSSERMPIEKATLNKSVQWLEEIRNEDEAHEGISAFLDKKTPNWVQ